MTVNELIERLISLKERDPLMGTQHVFLISSGENRSLLKEIKDYPSECLLICEPFKDA